MIDRTRHYSHVAITFHWIIAFLVIVNLTIGLLHESVPALRAWMPAHKSIGITILVLTAGRIAWRLVHRPPPLPAEIAGWQKGAAHALHWTLYALLIAMPLTGWAMGSNPERLRPFDWFGLFPVPPLPVGAAGASFGHGAHGVLGWLMLGLVAIHIAAALHHHFLLRNNVLARMVPALDRR